MGNIRRVVSMRDILNDPMTPPQSPESKRRRPNDDCYSEPQLHGAAAVAEALTGTPNSNIDDALESQTIAEIDNDSKSCTVGEVAYPVHGQLDRETRRQLDRFCVPSSDKISQSACHVAFSSDKRDFFRKTGRNGFQVFEYKFKYSEQNSVESQHRDLAVDKERVVMWDYNIGLVRIADLFKWQTKYLKTMPQRALASTPGLKELSHNITGGKVDCQGFWIPFEAAKALAATFCWKIRYALTPMFGPDFVELCVPPDDENFRNHKIDDSIIRQCNEQADKWKRLAKSYQCEPLREHSKSRGLGSGREGVSAPLSPEVSGRLRQNSLGRSFTSHRTKTNSHDDASDTQQANNHGDAIKLPATGSFRENRTRPKRQAASRARRLLQQNSPAAKTAAVSWDEHRDLYLAAEKLVEVSRDAHAEEAAAPGTYSWVSSDYGCECTSCRSTSRISSRKGRQ